MGANDFYQNSIQLIQAIEVCVDNHWVIPTTTLIYSGIDTMGWIVSDQDSATKQTFISWVETYLLPQREFMCSAIDLYAARCGVLHTQTPESSLYIKGIAKRISYAWGTATVEDFSKTINLEKIEDTVAVHLDDLHWGFRLGLADTVQDIFDSPELTSRFKSKVSKGFASLTKEDMDAYLTLFYNDQSK